MLKIAVATNDGQKINEHFGQAKVFHIYDVAEDGTFQLLEKRHITPHCPGDPNVGHTADTTVAQLADMDAVFVSRIGPGAAETLAGRGVKPFPLAGPIDRALTAYGKRHKLIDVKIPGLSQGFTTAGGESCGCTEKCR